MKVFNGRLRRENMDSTMANADVMVSINYVETLTIITI